MDAAGQTIVVDEDSKGRFARFAGIKWWNQSLLRQAKVLVIGAGALGNEVIKNLALLGIGNLVIVDMDRVEQSNLSRSVLFRPEDEGRAKAEAAAQAARQFFPEAHIVAVDANVLSGVGLGYFRWADIVVGALDNREARVFVNRACAQVGRPWIDGGIDVLNGIVRGFSPPASACYECTMGQADWDLLNKRRSCSLLARHAQAEDGTPTTPTTASVIGAMQAQEVMKGLHGLEVLRGRAFVFEGLTHHSFVVGYPVSPDCPWHVSPAPIESFADLGRDTLIADLWARCARLLGGLDAIDLSRELLASLACPGCGREREMLKPVDSIGQDDVLCPECGGECVPRYFHGITQDSRLLTRTVGEIGLPPWDVVWARVGDRTVGIELAADQSRCIGRTVSVARE